MFRNYFKTAYRSLIRNKSYALINIAGLAVGIAVCIIIFLIITFETSFDNFHKEDDQIFRVLTEGHGPDGINYSSGVPFPTPDALKNDFPTATIIPVYAGYGEQILILNPDGSIRKKLKEDNGVYHSRPEFFQVFNFPLIDGSALSLKEPNTVMLTQATAEKYFGDYKVAMGRTIKLNNDRIYKVTGIIKNPPANTDFQMRAIMSYATLKPDLARQGQDWRSVNSNHGLFMKVPNGVSESTLTRQLRAFLKRYRPPQNTYENSMVAQSIDKIHYDDDSGNLLGRTISPNLIDMLKLIALFILVIACVNFINLSTAQAVNRSKEVGVRKVLGSNRTQLQLQFYCETIIIVLLALVLAIAITMAALPAINSILTVSLTFALNANLVLFIGLLVIAVTILAGFYPALVLSGYSPINALKSKVANNKTSGISLRRALVVCQFVIAQALIIGTILIVKQMDYFQNSRMGFAKDAIITVPFPSDSIGRTKINFLRSRLSQMKDVQATSFSFASPADNSNWFSDITFNHAPKGTDFGVNLKWADNDYVPLYNIELAAGRNLVASDTIREFLVNQTLLRKLGITNDAEAINKDMNLWDQFDGKIVGVVKDFHASSFRSQLVPVLISTYKDNFNIANIKLTSSNVKNTIAGIEKLWDEAYPEYVFEYQFVDEKIASFYEEEQKLSTLYKIFAGLAIFLSCLGLYGLASFMAVQRLKEVGIRKVLGATVQNIIMLFSREFVILIMVAFAIAAPLAWYFLQKWLENYEFRTPVSWWIFIIAAFASITIAIITISFKAIRAARSNPVKSLRSE